jgi:CRISPR-associated protein (TIGR03986 family)
MPFHNPYHFVPVKAQDRSQDLSVQQFGDGLGDEIVHDRYVRGTKSGRIVCRLTTESSVVIGANRHGGPPASVDPFELHPGIPAIPGSSLRGLISSIVEAASNSALRVLEDRMYSFRRKADSHEALSAIGMVEVEERPGQPPAYWLRPLTWPTLAPGEARLPHEFSGIFTAAHLRVYVGNSDSIRNLNFPYTTWRADRPIYYGMQLQRREWRPGTALAEDDKLYRKNGYLLGQRAFDRLPRPWDEIAESEREQYTRGLMRVLGCRGRDAIPGTKRHELFIPYPEEATAWPRLPLASNVVERFHELADERTASLHQERADDLALLPYHPVGTARNMSREESGKFRLKHGDLVYFGARHGEVAEIALSSIWRGRVGARDGKKQTSYDFFRHVDSELLPFSQERQVITAAERLFGFVEQRERGKSEAGDALALCGRVRFSDGHLEAFKGRLIHACINKEYYEPSVTLRILGSPKPPCPALYFKTGRPRNTFIAKSELDATRHQPQGRKFYLHNRARPNGKPLWQTTKEQDGLKQKVVVTPVSTGAEFWFHIDFDNLTDQELSLLRYALRPTSEFRHKLGMGKSIGLGQVRIDPVGIFFVDRNARYGPEGLLSRRWSQAWLASEENVAGWPARYDLERKANVNVNTWQSFIPDPDIAKALELLGKPKTPQHVHTPTMNSDDYAEEEAFAWFVENEKIDSQNCLQPINASTPSLPTLPRDPANSRS